MRTLWMLMTGLVMAAVPACHVAAEQAPGTPSAVRPGIAPLKIVAFGDSLTSGHRLPANDTYPAVLERNLKAVGIPATVVNHGLNGDTTAGGVRRLADALAEQPQILIVAFGANDGLRGVPVNQVRSNLERIIETAQARGVTVVLVGMEALPLYGWQYTVDFHHVFRDLATKYKVPFVPFMLDGVLGNADYMSPDGVHPNSAGAGVIAANVLTVLRPVAQTLTVATR